MLLNFTRTGQGKTTVVLLHGMVGSARYWDNFTDSNLGDFNFIALDLLGFGLSPKPSANNYDYDDHIDAIIETLKSLGADKPFTIVAHSMGALIALRLAAKHPQYVNGLILCGLPYYPNKVVARQDITKSKKIWQLAYYGPTSHALCVVWCKWLRPVSKYAAPLYLKHVTRAVAADSLRHSWYSYSRSLKNIIEDQNIAQDIHQMNTRTLFIYGSEDICGQYLLKSNLISNQESIQIFDGLGHQLPIENPEIVIQALRNNQ